MLRYLDLDLEPDLDLDGGFLPEGLTDLAQSCRSYSLL